MVTPPNYPQKLGDVIKNWLLSLIPQQVRDIFTKNLPLLFGYIQTIFGGAEESTKDIPRQLADLLKMIPSPNALLFGWIFAALTGQPLPHLGKEMNESLDLFWNNPAKYFIQIADSLGNNPQLANVQKVLGQALVDIVITPLENQLDNNIEDTKAFAAQFHGALASLTLAGHVFSLAAEITGLGQIKTVGMAISDLYYNFGLGFMGWQTMSPLLDIGVKQAGARYYNKRYRPQRWSVSELTQLYALRQIDENFFRSEMQVAGYRDSDIDIALRLSEKTVSAGDVLSAYSLGMIDATEAVNRLHQNGYAPADIQFLIALEDTQRHQSDLDSIASSALTAFKKHLISEGQFRQMRAAGRIPQDRIDLEVQLANLETQATRRDLSVSNIKAAFDSNIIGSKEADNYLAALGLDVESRRILIDTWKEEKAPKVNRINSSTITQAYKLGLIDYSKGIDLLKSVGWSLEDAQLLMNIAKAQIPPEAPPPTPNDVISAYNQELITYQDAMLLLTSLGFDEASATLQLKVSTIKPVQATKTLTGSEVVSLFQVGVFSFDAAIAYLIGLGYDPQTAQLYIIAHTETKPKTTTTKKASTSAKSTG